METTGSAGGGQSVVGPFTRVPCDSGAVGVLSQDSRSLISASEHVGKHSDGIVGCLAWAGSGGIAGGGAELGNPLAQALSSITGTASISLGLIELGLCGICHLLDNKDTAAFFRPRLLDGFGVLLGYLGLLGVVGAGQAPAVDQPAATEADSSHSSHNDEAVHG